MGFKNKNIYRKIVKLIKEIDRSPFTGTGKPEPLKPDLIGQLASSISISGTNEQKESRGAI